MEPHLLTVRDFCERYRVSRTTVWRECKKGLPIVKIGRATRIKVADAEAWFERLEQRQLS